MSLFASLNCYLGKLSGDWEIRMDEQRGYLLHLDNRENFASIEIEYHREMVVRGGEVHPYDWGIVRLVASGMLPLGEVDRMVRDLGMIIGDAGIEEV